MHTFFIRVHPSSLQYEHEQISRARSLHLLLVLIAQRATAHMTHGDGATPPQRLRQVAIQHTDVAPTVLSVHRNGRSTSTYNRAHKCSCWTISCSRCFFIKNQTTHNCSTVLVVVVEWLSFLLLGGRISLIPQTDCGPVENDLSYQLHLERVCISSPGRGTLDVLFFFSR